MAASADIPHRDVHQEVQETLTSLGPGMAYSRLLRLRSGTGLDQPNLLLECDLCSSWRLTGDLAYEFTLRDEVRWQNIPPVNGRLLNANDIALSYSRQATAGWPNAPLLSSVAEVETLDDLTLRVELSVADADALLALADGHSKIVAAEVWEEYGDLKDSPVVGTGPWVWQKTEPGVGTVLSGNPGYFEPGIPFLDEIRTAVFKPADGISGQRQNRLAALAAGQVDAFSAGPEEWAEFRLANLHFGTAVSRHSGSGVLMAMNSRSPALAELAVRQAVFRAIDPWDYLDTVWSGQGFVSVGVPVAEPDWLLGRQEMRENYFADPSEGRRLMQEAGVGAGLDIEVTLLAESTAGRNLVLQERITQDLLAVGFNPTVRWMNPEQFNQLVIGPEKDFQLAIGAAPPTTSANSFLLALMHSQGRVNLAGHSDGVLDSLIEAQSSEFDPKKRQQQLKAIQRHILDQGYLFSPAASASRWVYSPALKGFAPNTALSEYNYWSRVWLEP